MLNQSFATLLVLAASALPALADPTPPASGSGSGPSWGALPLGGALRLPPAAAVPAPSTGGWYAGLSLGAMASGERGGDVDDALKGQVSFSTNTDLETDRFAWKLYGGYRFPETRWSVEFGYIDLGSFDAVVRAAPPDIPAFLSTVEDEYPLTGRGPTLAGQVHFLERETFGLSAKAGLWLWDAQGRFDLSIPPGGTGPSRSVDESGVDPFLGVGGTVGLTPELSARGEIEVYWLDGEEVYLFSAGLVVALGGGS